MIASVTSVAPSRVRGLKQLKFTPYLFAGVGRTLTGAWIETKEFEEDYSFECVAPSRVRGLKPAFLPAHTLHNASHPHGCVD